MLENESFFYVLLPLPFQFFSPILIQTQKLINVLAGIRKYWWEKFSKINKRTGTTIPDSRVDGCDQPKDDATPSFFPDSKNSIVRLSNEVTFVSEFFWKGGKSVQGDHYVLVRQIKAI